MQENKKEMKAGAYLKYIFRDTFRSMKENRMMSIASVLSILAALIILGIFLVFSANLDHITGSMEADMELKIFLKHDITAEQQTRLEKELSGYADITGFQYESAEQALQDFSDSLGEYSGILQGYDKDNNPMQASYTVQLQDVERIKNVKAHIENLKDCGVDHVKYGEEYVDALIKFSQYSNVFCIVMLVVLTVVSVFIIYNTIKLTCFARRREIRVMRYVGASDWYIRAPFVAEGLLLGISGAVIAILLISVGYYCVAAYAGKSVYLPMNASLVPLSQLIFPIILFCILYGAVIGAFGSFLSMRKFLDV